LAGVQGHLTDVRWVKPIGGLSQLKVRGLRKANAAFIFALAAYDLVRLAKLLEIPP
jgi:hypothetical protein